MTGQEKPRILCVSRSSSHLEAMCSALPHREYEVVSATTPEQAVAVCVSNNLAAVVLDSQFSTETGWSAARTFKLVKPHLLVVLLGHDHEQIPPQGVDAVASSYSAILHKLNALLNRGGLAAPFRKWNRRSKSHRFGAFALMALFHVSLEFRRDLIEPLLRIQFADSGKNLVAHGTAPRYWVSVDFFRNN